LSLPAPLALVLCLLGGALAQAQPAPTREPRRRSVTLTSTPIEARIATGTRTFFVFGVPIRGEAVQVDGARIKVVDTGKVSLVIEALSEPPPGKRWTMRVPLADGKSPEWAEFALVSHPSEVDTELELERPQEPASGKQTACEPRAPRSPVDAVASGLIDGRGVQTWSIQPGHAAGGFESRGGVSYRAWNWVLVDVRISPPPGHPAWRLTRATLKGRTGELRVRAVKVEPLKTGPGQELRVLVEADVPPPSAGLDFTLQLHGEEGEPSFLIPGVKLPPPAKEAE